MPRFEDEGDFEIEDEGGGLEWLAMIRDPSGIFRRQVRWMLVSFVILAIATAAATMLFPMRYEARGTILLTAKSIPDEYVPDTIIATILEQFETVRGEVFSRKNLAKIIQSTGLYTEERQSTAMPQLAARLNEDLVVTPISGNSRSRNASRSLAFEITFGARDPQLAAQVVNTTIGELINANMDYRSRQARVTTDFMQREFDRADQELSAHQRKLAQFRADHRGSLPEEQEATIAKLERIEEQRRSAILRLSDYRAQLERIDARPAVVGSQPSLDDLRERLRSAKALYTDDHPTVISLERHLATFQNVGGAGSGLSLNQIDRDERRAIEDGIRIEKDRLAQIDADTTRLEALLATAPTIADEYDGLIRNEQILRENFVEYLRKLKNAELALSLESSQQGAQLARLDPAIPPSSPKIPRWMIALAGLVASLGGALVIGLLREILFPVIIDQRHLEASIPFPCLGSVSRAA